MLRSNLRPKWWQLYLTCSLLIALFVLDVRLKISVRGHQAVQIGILLLVYGLIHLWLKDNAAALSNMDQEQAHGGIRLLRVSISQLSDPDPQTCSILDLPASEIKGVLSDTFDVEYIDAEPYPIDKLSQELKKE